MTVPRQAPSPRALQALADALTPGGRVVRMRPLHGGVSSSVHAVRLAGADGMRRNVVVRRFNASWHDTDQDVALREYRLLQVVAATDVPVPQPLWVDAQGEVFGFPTVVTSRVFGQAWLAPNDLDDYVRQMAHALVRLHAVPTQELGFLPDQRARVERHLASPHERDDPFEREIWSAIRGMWPLTRPSSRQLVHGDYWPGNVLWRRGRLASIIDWESPRLGDPGQDVGMCRGDLNMLFGRAAADAFLDYYVAAGGTPGHDLRFWELLHSAHGLEEVQEWLPGLHAFKRTDLTVERVRAALHDFARTALRA